MSSDTLAKIPAAPDIPERADALPIVPQRRFGQWAAAVLVLAFLGLALNSALRNQAFQWDVVADCFTSDSVLRGLWFTLWLTAVVMVLGRWRRRRRIVLPQAMRSIVPPAGNMLIGTLKGTSTVSVFAVNDLLFSAQLIYHRTYQVIPLLMVATLWYTVVTSVLGVGQYHVEKHYARGSERAR
ncbi:ABC transporter permease subunit [Streptomyces guryensis]|uniref:ABC transporter permease subunit n=1 Tax=Streptomyces guryensis TaxID=2886947 RepID=A0A9Q3VRW9_9ACTN|nr:ABC transporter permease subunit [Streptomyces guryensis]MCD9877509.1 ABC transporter permease subunit [Streptomyces guryensis]